MGFLRPNQARTTLLSLRRAGVSDFAMQHPAWMLNPPVLHRQRVRKHVAPIARGEGTQGARVYAQGFAEYSRVYDFTYTPRFENIGGTAARDIAGQNRVRVLRNDYLGQWLTLLVGKYEYTPVLLESFEAQEQSVNIAAGLVALEWRVTLTFTANSDVELPVWDRAGEALNVATTGDTVGP